MKVLVEEYAMLAKTPPRAYAKKPRSPSPSVQLTARLSPLFKSKMVELNLQRKPLLFITSGDHQEIPFTLESTDAIFNMSLNSVKEFKKLLARRNLVTDQSHYAGVVKKYAKVLAKRNKKVQVFTSLQDLEKIRAHSTIRVVKNTLSVKIGSVKALPLLEKNLHTVLEALKGNCISYHLKLTHGKAVITTQ